MSSNWISCLNGVGDVFSVKCRPSGRRSIRILVSRISETPVIFIVFYPFRLRLVSSDIAADILLQMLVYVRVRTDY